MTEEVPKTIEELMQELLKYGIEIKEVPKTVEELKQELLKQGIEIMDSDELIEVIDSIGVNNDYEDDLVSLLKALEEWDNLNDENISRAIGAALWRLAKLGLAKP